MIAFPAYEAEWNSSAGAECKNTRCQDIRSVWVVGSSPISRCFSTSVRQFRPCEWICFACRHEGPTLITFTATVCCEMVFVAVAVTVAAAPYYHKRTSVPLPERGGPGPCGPGRGNGKRLCCLLSLDFDKAQRSWILDNDRDQSLSFQAQCW